jgi:histone deacetylase 1/2
MPNMNSYEYLEKIKVKIFENLREIPFAPSVEMQDVPHKCLAGDDEIDAILVDADEDNNKDVRHTQRRWDQYVEADGELSESEDEGAYAKSASSNQNGQERRRRNETNHGDDIKMKDCLEQQKPTRSPSIGSTSDEAEPDIPEITKSLAATDISGTDEKKALSDEQELLRREELVNMMAGSRSARVVWKNQNI